jgi:RNA polymerase sigma-70 factor, ECF subfamily
VTADPGGRPAQRVKPYPDIESLVRATHRESARAAFRILSNHSDTEDAVQSAYVRVMLNWECVGSLETAGDQRAYLHTIVKNEARQILRRRSRRREDLGINAAESPSIAAQLADHVQAREDVRSVWRAICKLPPGRREVMLLYLDGYRYAEIAAIRAVSVGTVRSHISNARKQLRREMPGFREGEVE